VTTTLLVVRGFRLTDAMNDDASEWLKKAFKCVNFSKHFGPVWPKAMCRPPEEDREEYLNNVDFDSLVCIASSLRSGLSCQITGEYLGTYNCIYYLRFADDTRWVARIPIPFRQFTADDPIIEQNIQNRLFKSTIAAQTYAKEIKGVFAPSIYASFADADNPVGVPFIFMQLINGVRLDESIGHMTERGLRPVFNNLAREMISLASPPYFSQIGSIVRVGECYEVGPLLLQTPLDEDHDSTADKGPFNSVEEYFVSTLNRRQSYALKVGNQDLYILSSRLRALVPFFVDERYNHGPFILSPFDWESRDIFFGEDKSVCGVLDWDFASVVPMQTYFRYPPFMTKDWINGTKSSIMDNYRRLFRECLAELQDESEFPLMELLEQSRWFQMLDEGIQNPELGNHFVPILEAYVAAAKNKKIEVKPIPVVKALPVLKDVIGAKS
jgi:hypothetical protein